MHQITVQTDTCIPDRSRSIVYICMECKQPVRARLSCPPPDKATKIHPTTRRLHFVASGDPNILSFTRIAALEFSYFSIPYIQVTSTFILAIFRACLAYAPSSLNPNGLQTDHPQVQPQKYIPLSIGGRSPAYETITST